MTKLPALYMFTKGQQPHSPSECRSGHSDLVRIERSFCSCPCKWAAASVSGEKCKASCLFISRLRELLRCFHPLGPGLGDFGRRQLSTQGTKAVARGTKRLRRQGKALLCPHRVCSVHTAATRPCSLSALARQRAPAGPTALEPPTGAGRGSLHPPLPLPT